VFKGIARNLPMLGGGEAKAGPEPEFLNILKCNSAGSVGPGFQFNFMLFLMVKFLQ
jgi:hypothetical protein